MVLRSWIYLNYIKSKSQKIINMQNIKSLGERLKVFEEELERSKVGREQAKVKRSEVLAELQ